LCTCRLRKFTVNKEKVEYGEEYKLELRDFHIPFKYGQILDVILTDPSLSEEQNCNFVLTVIKNLKDKAVPPRVIHYSRRGEVNKNEELLKRILAQW
jgi:exosome complex RNA-binding protein Rrp42 (RNase PH superfamily)